MFLYCYDLETKNELLELGYRLLNTVDFNGQEVFVFANKGNSTNLNFDKSKVLISNKMNF